jgi:hypothetical protein
MGVMKEFESSSTLFGANAPFIEELYEKYLADPASVDAEWRVYFDELRGGAADVPHAPVVASFVELAKNRRVAGAMVDATTMHKQVLVLRLISKYRTLGMFAADLDPLKQHAPDYVEDLDLRTYGFTDADLDTEFDVGSYKGGPARMRPGRLHVLQPIGSIDFLRLMSGARLVLTASGGLQEETTCLGVPCLTLRVNTERHVTVEQGTNRIVGNDPQRIRAEVAKVLDGESREGRIPDRWDGQAARRIVDVLERDLGERR